MPDTHRLVEIRARREGSGYLITDRLVLTAWHLIRPAQGSPVPSTVGVRVEGRILSGAQPWEAEEQARLIWPLDDPGESFDFALLRLDTPFPVDSTRPLGWVALGGSGQLTLQAIGYPEASVNQTRRTRDTREVSGWTHLGDRVRKRKWGLDTIEIRMRDEDQPVGTPAGVWPGMSGAAVFCGELLVGVIRSADAQGQRGVLEALPVQRLFERPDVIEAVRGAGCSLPERVVVAEEELATGSTAVFRWPQAWDFEPFMRERREPFAAQSFEGRQWLFEEIDAWLAHGDNRAVLITADYGVGKSTLLSEYVHRHRGRSVVSWHFCQSDTWETLLPATFVRSVAAQLAESLPAYRQEIERRTDLQKRLALDSPDSDPVSAFDLAVLAPLLKIPAPEGMRLLVVDAVDTGLEIARGEKPEASIVGLLAAKALRFPRWLRVLVTSRGNPEVVMLLRGAFVLKEIDAQNERNLRDLRRFVLRQVSRASLSKALGSLSLRAFTRELLAKSGGKFLFVVHALRDIESGTLSIQELVALPPGMDAFYREAFEHRFGPGSFDYNTARKLLGIMCVLREPLCRADLAEILGQTEEGVRTLHARLPDFLQLRDGRLTFHHHSLVEWLTEESKQGFCRAGRFGVSLEDARSCIRTWALSRLKARTVHTSAYLVQHLAAHLRDDAERSAIYADLLLERFEWSQARLELSGVPGLLADVQRLGDHPERDLFETLVQNSEACLRRSTTQWCAQVFGRLGPSGDSAIGLRRLVASAQHWLADGGHGATGLLVPLTRSFRMISAQKAVIQTGGATLARMPGGRIAAGYLNTVCVLDPERREAPIVFRVAIEPIDHGNSSLWVLLRELRVLRDGRIVCGDSEGKVRVWDPMAQRAPLVLDAHSEGVSALAELPDDHIISAGRDRTVRVWDLKRLARPVHCWEHSEAVVDLVVRFDGRIVAHALDGAVFVFDSMALGDPIVLNARPGDTNASAVMLDGRVVLGARDGTVRLWNPTGSDHPVVIMKCPGTVVALEVSAAGVVVCACREGAVCVWDPAHNGEAIGTHHPSAILALALLPGGEVVSGHDDGTVRVWDPKGQLASRVFEGHTDSVTGLVVLSADCIASGDMNAVRIWDRARSAERIDFVGHANEVKALVALPDGRVASGGEDGSVRLWDSTRRISPVEPTRPSNEVVGLAALPDGRIASGHVGGEVWIWDPGGQVEPIHFQVPADIVTLAALPDGRIVTADWDDFKVRVWDPTTGSESVFFTGYAPQKGSTSSRGSLAVLPDGHIFVGTEEWSVWGLFRHGEPFELIRELGPVEALAVLPGRNIVSATHGGTLWIGDPTRAERRTVFKNEERLHRVTALAMLDDGRVASRGYDGIVWIWIRRRKSMSMLALGGIPVGLHSGSAVWRPHRCGGLGNYSGVVGGIAQGGV